MLSKKSYIRYVLLIASLVFIVIGIMRDEYITILRKAINVCLECIGIG